MFAELDQVCIDTLRCRSMNIVQKANSGHPGLPLGAVSMACVLWALGGLDTLVFAGDSGDNAPIIRQRISGGPGIPGIRCYAARAVVRGGVSPVSTPKWVGRAPAEQLRKSTAKSDPPKTAT